MEAKKDRVTMHGFRHDRHTVSLLSDHLVFFAEIQGEGVGGGKRNYRLSTIEIASYTNLTPDRVRYICSLHKEIRPMMEKELWPNKSLEEKWSIRELVDL